MVCCENILAGKKELCQLSALTYIVAQSNIMDCCLAFSMIIGARFLSRNMLETREAASNTIQDRMSDGYRHNNWEYRIIGGNKE